MRILTLTQADSMRNGKDFIFIGSTPHSEDCTQAGGDREESILECRILINQLRRLKGQEPEGTQFFILENHHEFGDYFEACIFYDLDNEAAEAYAFECEELPEYWGEAAKQELREAGHSKHQPAKIIHLKRA